ncbi:hypothetical protein FSARC_8869 [Fusarium sarcochroum]|uniref:PiggyBac transposable element-derived protein domain-containing protein n=1 Tax=Fusarium sarcochroum TaxID=1208366 RepID=A0A8H4TS19_9HYPO|nr:hypothetical protein FSARC_8869 [Fusarium sarcochroum]
MPSQSIPSQTQDSYDFDDSRFHPHSKRGPNDPTGVPDFPAEEAEGTDFTPFNIQYRDFKINPLPQKPLELFQLFVPISLVQSWIEYTNDWVTHLIENGVIDNWNNPLKEHSRILQWDGISTATAYIWLGVMIYLGIHREISIKDHWKAPSLGDQRPLHMITKFMPLRKFELITRYFRTFDYTKLDVSDERDLPKTFQAAQPRSEHIQNTSAELFIPGTNLAVDECMIPYKGRSKETTIVKNKPTPCGFKVWVIAQHGFFLRWLWHVKGSPYKAVVVNLPLPKKQGKKGKAKTTVPLSNTQSVVFYLCNMLPKATYHVFTDNLFSSPNLFRALREAGYGATGTARPNCGISTKLKKAKEGDKSGKGPAFQYNEVRVIFTVDSLISQVIWKDNSAVLFLSTVFSGANKERIEKKRKKPANKGAKSKAIEKAFGDDASKVIPIPKIAAEYNQEMNHVDRGDQLRSYTTYEHRFRRGPWQALLWGFLLDIALANSFILQLKTTSPNWERYTTLKDWKECIYNAIFNTYAVESEARKRGRTGQEEDIENAETHRIHIQRDINHVWRGKKSACLACKGLKQGQSRPFKKRAYLKAISGNATRRRQTKYGCKRCNVAICNNATC